ncbi:T9SS type A sorting domain-containing protein [Seonamhaeicola aphaedonensis]|uniref:Putative secreted protein (Por secretion system target) n=1 Tax=Seonamhaeicola aphaedonensis TaxID=1461338 RepID=A0A3D9HET4_9FLAO|nr:T9SS type A sorting domain-containing protein [Seonamhaeicola aphaedonensis]RED47983.1 putative secreted protein (Por secretion system target) [Seonamhaeicola aphaedonensis]
MNKNYFFIALLLFLSVNLNAQTTLTQSVNPNLVEGSGNACWNPGGLNPNTYNDNSFYRAYNLSDFSVTGNFQITSVQFGQGSADTGKEITLKIHTANTDDLTNAVLTEQASTTHICNASNNLQVVSVPLSVSIPSNSTIVFEVFAPDSGTNTGELFFIGTNSAGQNDDSYISFSECAGWTDPTIVSDQYVMNVVGDEVLGIDDFKAFKLSITPNPTKDIINIDLDNANVISSMNLYNITGQLIYKNIKSKRVDLSELKTGIYLLEVGTEKGKIIRKIIKN